LSLSDRQQPQTVGEHVHEHEHVNVKTK